MKGIYSFLDDVAANNSREWLAANRERYDALRAQWIDDLDRLIALMCEYEPGMNTQTGRSATYRFYRDTRFSPDKSPLKTFFSAALSAYGRKAVRAGYYLQVDSRRDQNGLYIGLYCPDAPLLRKMRQAIVDNIEEFTEIINEPRLASLYPGWIGDALKTVPKGWPKDHPDAELLRLKDYGKFHQTDRRYFESERWYERAAEDFSAAKPLIDFLNYTIDE